jgi:hypothetical protein
MGNVLSEFLEGNLNPRLRARWSKKVNFTITDSAMYGYMVPDGEYYLVAPGTIAYYG